MFYANAFMLNSVHFFSNTMNQHKSATLKSTSIDGYNHYHYTHVVYLLTHKVFFLYIKRSQKILFYSFLNCAVKQNEGLMLLCQANDMITLWNKIKSLIKSDNLRIDHMLKLRCWCSPAKRLVCRVLGGVSIRGFV